LHVNASDIYGGAARATYRLHRALLNADIDSQMLVQTKGSDDSSVIARDTKIQKFLAKLGAYLDSIPVLFYKNRTGILFSPACIPSLGLVDCINALNPDLVHLHWINNGMMQIEDIAKIKAPIVWSLHDNWAFTGGCHIMWECDNYKHSCGSCLRLNSLKENDLSRKVFNRKRRAYSAIDNMTIVGLSSWLVRCARESSLFRHTDVLNLPNPLNTEVYAPVDRLQARELCNLPVNKKLVLFGAVNATSDINKGFNQLSKALSLLERDDVELVVFGSSQSKNSQSFKHKSYYLGYLHDEVSLRLLYSAADVMIVPSQQEAFGQTASESMACGTPVVAYACAGLLDIVDHKKNGYLANPFDTDDLAAGIEWVLNAKNYDELSVNARNKVLNEFDSELVVKKYIKLYERILNKIE